MLWIHYCEFSNASVVVYPALLYRLPVAFSLIFLPPCGSFKCGSLWFIPGHFKENTQPNRKRKPEPQVGVFFPLQVCCLYGWRPPIKTDEQHTGRERGDSYPCDMPHLQWCTHTHKQQHTHSSLGSAVLSLCINTHTVSPVKGKRKRRGVCGGFWTVNGIEKEND